MEKIGIALGSGSARGWAHIGVLQALNELGIKPSIVAGCSIGAVVGASYCLGKLTELEGWVSQLTRSQILSLFDIKLFRGGLVKGIKVLEAIWGKDNQLFIENLPIQFATVATDIENGNEIWLTKGNLMEAVRASCAMPGFFSPTRINDRWLVDGGLVNPVPVSICRALGADKIIAVNLNKDIMDKHKLTKKKQSTSSKLFKQIYEKSRELISLSNGKETEVNDSPPSYLDVLASSISIMQYRITNSRLAGDAPDVIIEPFLSKFDMFDYDRATDAIVEGRNAVERAIRSLEYCFTNDQCDNEE